MLESLASAVDAAEASGIRYGEIMEIDEWELIFERTGKNGPLPVIKHAVYNKK